MTGRNYPNHHIPFPSLYTCWKLSGKKKCWDRSYAFCARSSLRHVQHSFCTIATLKLSYQKPSLKFRGICFQSSSAFCFTKPYFQNICPHGWWKSFKKKTETKVSQWPLFVLINRKPNAVLKHLHSDRHVCSNTSKTTEREISHVFTHRS